jgi:hypothetical protein
MAQAQSTTLIFQPSSGSFTNGATLPATYGNRVTAASQGGFLYQVSGGGTPNVVVQHSTGAMPTLFTWDNQYGDLVNVITAVEPQVFQFKLIADPGFNVVLNSFDMASWPGVDYTINSVDVKNGSGGTLFAQSNVLIEGDANGPKHTHFAFSGVSANTLLIEFDASNVDSDDVGIDNINFSQVSASVPEPGALGVLMGTAVTGGLFLLKRRKGNRPA